VATDILYAASVNSGSTTSSSAAYGAEDTVYTGDTDNTSWTCRWNMDTMALGALSTTANAQSISVRVRKQTGTGTPTYVLNVYEDGTLQHTSASTSVTSLTGQNITHTWTSAGSGGQDIDVEFVVSAVGGNPATRASVQVDAITYTADYIPPITFQATMSGQSDSSGSVDGLVTKWATASGQSDSSGSVAGLLTKWASASGQSDSSGSAAIKLNIVISASGQSNSSGSTNATYTIGEDFIGWGFPL